MPNGVKMTAGEHEPRGFAPRCGWVRGPSLGVGPGLPFCDFFGDSLALVSPTTRPRRRSTSPGLQLRAAALLFDASQRLLLVRQRWLRDESYIWRPPGGALDAGGRSLADVAVLETWLETGLRIEVLRPVILCESAGGGSPWRLTAYFLAQVRSGELISGLDYANGPLELAVIESACFLTQAEVQAREVRPAYLHVDVWADLEKGFRDAPRFRPAARTSEP